MNSLTFGRYTTFDTFTHKVDARNKIVLLILLIVAIFLKFEIWSTALIMSGLLLIVLIALMLISRVSILSLLKSFLGMWPLILFLLLIYILIPNATYSFLAFKLWKLNVYWDAFFQCGYIILRLVMMIGLTMILTSTTKPMDLTRGFEWYMSPLKVIKFPAHEIAMTISIALRFIPTLLEETDRIMKAQASRGVDFTRGRLFKRFKALFSLIIPLLISSFQRSEELADAMEARGYNPREKRTSYSKLTFTWRDIVAFLVAGSIFGGVLTLFILDKNTANIDLIQTFFNISLGW